MPPKRNPFAIFALSLRDEKGNQYSMPIAVKKAAPLWENMSELERQPYYIKGKKSADAKLTNIHENIAALQKEEERLLHEEIDMKQHIDSIIMASFYDVKDLYFNVLHMNDHLLKTSVTDRPYPAEIGMAKFNLQDGVLPNNIYSEIICPGKLQLGFAAEAGLVSKTTHNIPPPAMDQKSNMELIMKKIDSFMLTQLPKLYKIIYVDEIQILYIRKVFDYFCKTFGYERNNYRIYSLQYLFYALRNSDTTAWPSVSISKREILKDVFDHTNDISCEMHELLDTGLYCSRSIVTRYIYSICDNCCPSHNIELIPGQHVPKHSVVNVHPIVNESVSEFYSCSSDEDEALNLNKTDYPYTIGSPEAAVEADVLEEIKFKELVFVETEEEVEKIVKPPLRRPNTVSATKKPFSNVSPFGIKSVPMSRIAANFNMPSTDELDIHKFSSANQLSASLAANSSHNLPTCWDFPNKSCLSNDSKTVSPLSNVGVDSQSTAFSLGIGRGRNFGPASSVHTESTAAANLTSNPPAVGGKENKSFSRGRGRGKYL